MLAQMNCYLTRESRILDFGCGDGRHVYEYRDAGFNAYGFDIRPAPMYRCPADEQYFRFALTGKPMNVSDFLIDQAWYLIPFEAEFFDFVFSSETMEHVQDHELVFRETARVLKKGGVAIHTFPARYVPVEPHIFVPFGGVIHHFLWFFLWACLGIRNEFQRHMGPVECARDNARYARTGLNYMKVKEILNISRRYYREAELMPRLWELGDKANVSFKAAMLLIPHVHRYVRWLYSRFHIVVLFLRK